MYITVWSVGSFILLGWGASFVGGSASVGVVGSGVLDTGTSTSAAALMQGQLAKNSETAIFISSFLLV